jgi:hypothetical protein
MRIIPLLSLSTFHKEILQLCGKSDERIIPLLIRKVSFLPLYVINEDSFIIWASKTNMGEGIESGDMVY